MFSFKDKPVELTAREYALVEFLALHRGEVVTRTQLYEHLFDENESSLSNLLDVHVSNVRKKLGAEFIVHPARPRLLHRMKIFKSIKWRLQIWYGLILVVVLAGFGFTAYQLERGRQFVRIDDELHRRIGVLANALHRPPPRGTEGNRSSLLTGPPPGQFPDDGPPGQNPARRWNFICRRKRGFF
jgi:hypothetical protein